MRSAVNLALVKMGAQDMATVKEWLKEEEEYLRKLSKEPLEDTLEMEYYKLLLKLNASKSFFFWFRPLLIVYRCTLAVAVLAWTNLTMANIGQRDMTASTETA